MTSTAEASVRLGRALHDGSVTENGRDINVVNIIIGIACAVGILVLLPILWRRCGYLYPLDGLFDANVDAIREARRRRREQHEATQARIHPRRQREDIEQHLIVKLRSTMRTAWEQKFEDVPQIQQNDAPSEKLGSEEGVTTVEPVESSPVSDAPESDADEEMNKDGSPTCHICLEAFQTGDDVALSNVSGCQHTFHRNCIVEWLQRQDECPCCRAKFFVADDSPKPPG